MNLIELNRALGQLRLGGIAAVLETRLRQAQAEAMPPIDFLSCLVSDELTRRGERLLERRTKKAEFRDPQKTLDNFDFNFNRKMNRSLVFDLATGAFIEHQTAIHLSVEVEVEVVESFLRVSKLGLFCSALQQSLATTSEFVGDEAGEEVDRGHGFGLSLAKAGFE